MCVQSQPYVPAYHALLSAYGKSWSERLVAMFTAYIDDSGTDPNQKVAIAAALLIPAHRLIAFQSEWDKLSDKWGIFDFHSSICAAANAKSDMAGRCSEDIRAAFARIRHITRKYGVKAYSLSVNKSDYESVILASDPDRAMFGQYHYTYAVQNLLSVLDGYACQTGIEYPVEYVFDSINQKTEKLQRREIEDAIARMELARPGRFEGHYSFRKRQDYPGLQCADLIAWACYAENLSVWGGPSPSPLQKECYEDFSRYRNGEWLAARGQTKKMLQNALKTLRAIDRSKPIQVRTFFS
jgi:hypothetical protein